MSQTKWRRRRRRPLAACFVAFGFVGRISPLWSAAATTPTEATPNPISPESQGRLPVLDTAPPNVILLLADNLGYEDISWLAGSGARSSPGMSHTTTTAKTTTPPIDSIGAHGMTLLHWNSAAHLCSASRAALLTGLYPARTGVYPGVFHPDAALGLAPTAVHELPTESRTQAPDSTSSSPKRTRNMAPDPAAAAASSAGVSTLAKLLKDRGGYSTAMVGKWHLGHLLPYLPTQHGFDEWLGVPYHMSGGSVRFAAGSARDHTCVFDTQKTQGLPLYHNNTIIQQPVHVDSLVARYTQATTDFIQRHAAKPIRNKTTLHEDEKKRTPFFLYMAFSHVHQLCAGETGHEQSTCQWAAPTKGTNTNSNASFRDALSEMDGLVGTILQALSDNNIPANETIIAFTSDNGPWLAEQACAGLAGPFQGQWLRDNVPLDCTACPHDYAPRPTRQRPRRCQLWRQPSRSISRHCNTSGTTDKLNGIDYDDDSAIDDIDSTVDGVHCGADSGLGSVWEANLRMPALVSWPDHIAHNSSTAATVSSLDLVPTILKLTGLDQPETDAFDGVDISSVLLGREEEYDSDNRVLFFWRDGFLSNLAPLGPPYGRFDVVAVKIGPIKAWYWTKSAHYNADVEQYHNPPLLFDVLRDPGEAHPIDYPNDDADNFYVQLVLRIEQLIQSHKKDMAASSYPLTLHRDARYIPCFDATTGCRTPDANDRFDATHVVD